MSFNNWIDTFVSEKTIEPDQMIEAEGPSGMNLMPVEILIGFIKAAPKPVLDYFSHLAKAIAI
jgi:hypothetical protein